MSLSKRLINTGGGVAAEPFFNLISTFTASGPVSRTGVGFQPDVVWFYSYQFNNSPQIYDSVRGARLPLLFGLTNSELYFSDGLLSFDSDGYTTGNNTGVNNSRTIAVCWKAGGDKVANNEGSIASNVSASPENGFSVVQYTGTGNVGTPRNVGHGLNQAPEISIIKRRSASNIGWIVYTTLIDGSNDYLFLNTTAAKDDSVQSAPTSTVVNIQDDGGGETNSSGLNYIMYNFHSVDGVSKIGTYDGDGGNQTLDLGFQPAGFIVKATSTTSNWVFVNKLRVDREYQINSYAGDDVFEASAPQLTSTGVNLRNGRWNASGVKYLYMAFAAPI